MFRPGMIYHYLKRPVGAGFLVTASSGSIGAVSFAQMTYYDFCVKFEVDYGRDSDEVKENCSVDIVRACHKFVVTHDVDYVLSRRKTERFYRDRFLTPLDGEAYYRQKLLKYVPVPVQDQR